MSKEYRIYFGKKFSKRKDGYWIRRDWVKDKKKYVALLAHRWVWENVNGAIPDNMDVHHIDGDPSNNSIENLKLLSRSDHRKEHWSDPNHRPKCLKQLEDVRPTEWLKSSSGRKAVSEKGKQIWKERKLHKIICEHCGKEAWFKRWARFCHKNCYMKWRHKMGLCK